MGFIFSLIKRLIRVSIYFILFAAAVTLIPNLPPYTSFSSIQIDPIKFPVDALKLEGSLNQPEQLFKGKLLGPETLKVFNDEIYTSVATGEIVKISPGGHITFVTKIGRPCSGLLQEHICGRILGFDIDKTKSLIYVADVYYGIWKVDLKTDKKTLLVSLNVEIEGRKPKFVNSLILAKNGDFYWTDSSSDYDLKDGAMIVFSDPSGRFFHYNAAKNQSRVLIDNLWFPNGVVLSPNEDFAVVSETLRSKLLKYYLTGPMKGKTEDFITGLPGTPDNLQVLPDGSGILVAIYSASDENQPQLVHSLAKAPLVRKFIARALTLVELAFENLNKLVPNVIFEEIIYKIGHISTLSMSVASKSGLIHVDWTGKVVKSYFNIDGSLDHTSDGVVYKNKLYLGAPHKRNFIAAVPAPPELIKAFTPAQGSSKTATKQHPEKPVVKEQKPVVKEQKPVVKEQKPVVKEQKPVVKEQKPVVKEQKPVVKEQKPVVKEQKPVVKEQKPVVKEQKPVVKEQKPVVKEQKPIVKEEKLVGKDQKPEAKVQKPQIQEKKPVSTESKHDTQQKPTAEKPKVESKSTDKVKKPPKPQVEKPAAAKDSRERIPIEEEIASDTAKPNKETLKVIKKGGPAEIPNPHV